MLVVIISLVNIVLFSLLYEKLIKITFFKVLEREDSRNSTRSNIDISSISPQNSFRASLSREAKFLLREKKGLVFNLQFIIISVLAIITGIVYRLEGNGVNTLTIPFSMVSNIETDKIFIILVVYLASLFIDIVNFTLHTSRFAQGGKYLYFEKYIQLKPKNTLFSILLLKFAVAVLYYLTALFLLYAYNLLGSYEMWAFTICILNVITVVCFDTIIDVKLPNLYNKMSINNFVLDIAKPAIIILFKTIHFFTLILATKYLFHNIFLSLIAINLLFLFTAIALLNSKSIIKSYNRISYVQ
jgi:hypothetical protein